MSAAPKLLNPGPVTLTPRVRRAMLGQDLCHREPEYARLQEEVRAALAAVYHDARHDYTAVLLTGSGTCAVEAMVGSLVPRDGRALVVANGVYGERIASMLQAQGKDHDVARSPFTEPMNLAEVEGCLSTQPRPTRVLAVHHETTTGRLNDVAALGALCRRYDVPLLLDAVSSFAGEGIDFAGWNVEAVAATANKCLHGVPGTCFVLARSAALRNGRSAAPSVYLDLFAHARAQDRGGVAFTPAVQSMYALREALAELEEAGGWEARSRHYQDLSARVRRGLAELGVVPLLAPADHSASLTAFLVPPGLTFGGLYEGLKRAGFVIYPGQLALEGRIFRIAVMGDLTRGDMDELLRAFASLRTAAPVG
jgi:2-aminoethylphosphonate-pyruvate transaminase